MLQRSILLRGDMAVAAVLLLISLLLHGETSLPITAIEDATTTPDDTTHVVLHDNNTRIQPQSEFVKSSNTFSQIKNLVEKLRLQSLGEPNPYVGELVAAWTPDWTHNPEELGLYTQGDILHPPSSEFRNGMTDLSYRWPHAVVPYVIVGTFNEKQRGKIQAAMAEYHKHTCVRFVPFTGIDQPDYVTIESAATGCWSSLGRVGGAQVVNFQTPSCLYHTGTVIHELMHALGFFHEQSRSDRDNYIDIDWKNVIPGQEYNFDKYESLTYGVGYDYGSVMHYSNIAFSKNTKPSILPKVRGMSIGQRKGLSQNDIAKIRAMYKCAENGPHL